MNANLNVSFLVVSGFFFLDFVAAGLSQFCGFVSVFGLRHEREFEEIYEDSGVFGLPQFGFGVYWLFSLDFLCF
jgi:hypothetical protein